MVESGKAGATKERKSLLAFSRGRDAEAAEADPVSNFAEDAQARHRLARSRREARRSPILEALAVGEEDTDGHGREVDADREPQVSIRDSAPAAEAVSAGPRRETVSPEPVSQPVRQEGIADRVKSFVSGWRKPDPDAPAKQFAVDRVSDHDHFIGRDDLCEGETAPREGETEIWTPLIDPLKVIGRVVDSKLLIVSTTILGALIGVAIALQTPKKYEAITELLVDPRDLKLSERDLTVQGLPSDATLAIVENQARILTSGTVLNKVVGDLKLDADPEFNGQQKSFGLGAFIAELRSILSRGDGAGDSVDYRRTIAIENLARALTVERGGKTFVITIGVATLSPQKSALIANTMTDVFLETYGQIQSQTAGRAADELTARLDELRKGVEDAERKVATFKAENDIIDPQGRLITDDEIIKLNDQLSTARARTLELNARAASARDVDVDSVVAGAIPESINSSVIGELRSQYASLKNEADRIAVRLGPRHPERQAMDAQLAGARDQIATELRRIASSVQVELKRAVELEQQLAQRLAQLKVRQGDMSGELVQLRELEREASTKRAVYEAYLLRARETGEQRDINTANMSVISKAYPPLDPSGPSRSMIALAGMFLGFASGVGFAMMRGAYESLRDRRRAVQGARPQPPAPRGDGPRPTRRMPGAGAAVAEGGLRENPRSAAGARAASDDSQPVSAENKDTTSSEDSSMHTRPMDFHYPYAGEPVSPATPAWAQEAPPAPYAEQMPAYVHPAQPPLYQQQAFAQPQPASYPAPYAGYAPPAYPQVPAPPAAYAPPMHPAHAYAPQPDPRMHPAHWQGYGAPAAPQHAPVHGAAPAAPYPPSRAYPPQAYAPAPQPRAANQPIPFPVRNVQAVDAPQPASQTLTEQETSSAIADIRASLAEFREAVRDFTESRQRRRFF